MKEYRKYIYSGIAAIALVFTSSFTAFSEPFTKTIQATYENIKIYVDGNLISPKDANGNKVEPFTSEGTTYLPARAVAEALGKSVNWDDSI